MSTQNASTNETSLTTEHELAQVATLTEVLAFAERTLAYFQTLPDGTRLNRDPRGEDFPEDSEQWRRLLGFAVLRYGASYEGVFGVLLGLRCCGAKLTMRDDLSTPTYVIEPRYSKRVTDLRGDMDMTASRDTEWETQDDYLKSRQALLPLKEEAKWLLEALAAYETHATEMAMESESL